MNDHHTTHAARNTVREGYAQIAKEGQWSGVQPASRQSGCCGGGGCCGSDTLDATKLARAIGYAQSDLGTLPDGANMGLSCGNPTALASLAMGEVVVDLGSGGGLDCFIAGPKVGATGRVIGVDMTPEMLTKARDFLPEYERSSGLSNVEFRLGEIEALPVADVSADAVISNCVINLSTDKPRVWREIARVLKPGGRVAASDLALRKPLPDAVAADVEALVGCVAGAQLVEDVRASIEGAGLTDVVLTEKPEYVEAMSSGSDPLYAKIAQHLSGGAKISDYVVSLDITARK